MIIYGTNITYKQAPLPLFGQKKRYIKRFQRIIERLPKNSRVFDAFSGSGLLSRVAKDTRPDLEVFTNDFEYIYKKRLDCVDDTNRVLGELWKVGAYRNNDSYEKYTPEIEARLKEIVATGKDAYTCKSQIYCKQGATVRAICRSVLYDEWLCEHWYDWLNICNFYLKNDLYSKDVYYILDPPYIKNEVIKRTKGTYLEGESDARNFCKECILNHKNIVLFDEVGSDLIELFMSENKGHFDAFMPEYKKMIYVKDMMITNIVE